MLVVISPAKRLDWNVTPPMDATLPEFHEDAIGLAAEARALGPQRLRKLMGLSEKLAILNHDRFTAFDPEPTTENARPAALAFAGDTYTGLDAQSLDVDEWRQAQSHLRILSGLYGVLRPLDMIQAYRLEMGSRLKTARGANLYAYWGDRIARALNATARESGSRILLNCASTEYFGAVDLAALEPEVITPQFLEERDGDRKIVSFFAKKARGSMARFVVQNRITEVGDLAGFETGGYRFDAAASSPQAPVFVRDYPEAGTDLEKLAS